jgi:prepilin-type N-terminal cleavage/methylation domain-containing protein
MTRATHTTRLGFSLIEMLVVVSIIAVVLALSFPMIGAMRRDSSVSAGVNTIAQAASAIRLYATRNVVFPTDLLIDDPRRAGTIGSQGGLYSGAAAIFTPAGEIRLTRNYAQARSSDLPGLSASSIDLLERVGPTTGLVQGSSGIPVNELNGFTDLLIDYILLPKDTGVAGINRVSVGPVRAATSTNPPLLLAPPFAVWFDQSGYMIATGWDSVNNIPNDYQFVYYDGNYDGDYAIGRAGTNRSNMAGGYNPDFYNPNDWEFNAANWDAVAEKYVVPFEQIEAVVGVYVYSLEAFDNAVQDGIIPPWASATEADNLLRWNWMKENGQMLMFSKQTGALMRTRDE